VLGEMHVDISARCVPCVEWPRTDFKNYMTISGEMVGSCTALRRLWVVQAIPDSGLETSTRQFPALQS
jgi:hypothetical protein